MSKKLILIMCSASMTIINTGNVTGCLSKAESVTHQEIQNGDAALVAKTLVAAALPKLLANGNVQKFENKTNIKATQNAAGGYDFSLLGVPVASSAPQQDPATLISQLVPHIITACKAAETVQAAPVASSSASSSVASSIQS